MLEVLFQYGPFTLRTFNLFLAVGFVFTGFFVIRFTLRQKMNLSFLSYAALPLLGIMLLGGRLFYVISNWNFFSHFPLSTFFLWDLRFSFFGIIYGLIAGLFFFSKKRKEDFWAWLDTGILALLLMMIFIHIGHFFDGKNYGLPTDLPWGIAFDSLNIRFLSPVHPTQIYAALFTLGLLIYSIKKSKRIYLSGVVGNKVLMIYSLGLFGIDFLHGTPSWPVKINFLILAVISFIFMVHCSHKSHSFGQ